MRYLRVFLAVVLLLGIFAINNSLYAADWYYVARVPMRILFSSIMKVLKKRVYRLSYGFAKVVLMVRLFII